MHLHFIREGDGYAEAYFARYLVEDRANFPGGALSYTGRSDDKLLSAIKKKNCGIVLYCIAIHHSCGVRKINTPYQPPYLP